MNFTQIFQNVALSALWGVNIFFTAARDTSVELAIVAGLLTFVAMLATLWLIVDTEFDEQTAELARATLWGMGLGFLGLILCLTLLQVVE